MNRPTIKDAKAKLYVEYLENKLSNFSSSTTKVKSYIALKNFIEKNSEALGKVDINSDTISDKEDRLIDRAMKFFKELDAYIANLEKMAEMISPEEIKKTESKLLKSSGVSVEEMIKE